MAVRMGPPESLSVSHRSDRDRVVRLVIARITFAHGSIANDFVGIVVQVPKGQRSSPDQREFLSAVSLTHDSRRDAMWPPRMASIS
jgi:hypothetical protein